MTLAAAILGVSAGAVGDPAISSTARRGVGDEFKDGAKLENIRFSGPAIGATFRF